MGLRPTKGGENAPFQQLLSPEAPPSPLSSRPEKSWAFGPPKVMKNGSCSAATVAGSAALPFVISTGEVMGLRPTQGDEKTGPVQQPHSMEAPPSPLSSRPELRRSVVERSAVSAVLSWKCFRSVQRIHSYTHINSGRVPHVRTSERGLMKTGRSPIKGLSSVSSHNHNASYPGRFRSAARKSSTRLVFSTSSFVSQARLNCLTP
jgi:hypothetical protein